MFPPPEQHLEKRVTRSISSAVVVLDPRARVYPAKLRVDTGCFTVPIGLIPVSTTPKYNNSLGDGISVPV